MSKTIDERIVDMQFNNKQFEDGIRDTLVSLETLKKNLGNMGDTGHALEGIGDSANKLGLDFSALEVMVITALAKMTDALIDFGLATAEALILDPIVSGFEAYEEQVNTTKAIMNAAQMSAKGVNAALANVVFYADETNFSFKDMVDSVRLFTSSGLELDDATLALQGIGSASALAGVPLGKMETVFSSLSKAVGQGSIRIREWDSLNLAGLTTSQDVKQLLLDTAVSMGTLTKSGEKYIANYIDPLSGKAKAMEVSLGDMRTALKSGYLSTDVLMEAFKKSGQFAQDVFEVTNNGVETSEEVLKRYGLTTEDVAKAIKESGNTALIASQAMDLLGSEVQSFGERGMRSAQEARTFTDTISSISEALSSRWRTSWQLIIGDVDQATDLWNGLVEVLWDLFVVSGDVRNEMLKVWGELGGRDILIQGVSDAFEGLLTFLEPIGEAFAETFESLDAKKLLDITQKFANLMAQFRLSEDASDKLKRTFKGLFAIVDILGKTFGFIVNVIKAIVSAIFPMSSGILSLTANIGDFLVSLNKGLDASDIFKDALTAISKAITSIKTNIGKAISFISDAFSDIMIFLDPYIKKFKTFGIDLINGLIVGLKSGVKDAKTAIVDACMNFIKAFKDFFGIKSPSKLMAELAGMIIDGLVVGFNNSVAKLKEIGTNVSNVLLSAFNSLKDGLSWIGKELTGVGQIGSGIRSVFNSLGATINTFIGGILDLGLHISNLAISFRDSMVELDVWGKITRGLSGIIGGISTFISNLISVINVGLLGAFAVVSALLTDLVDFLVGIADGIGTAIKKIGEYFSRFGKIDLNPLNAFTSEVEGSFKPFSAIAEFFKSVIEAFVKVWEWVAPVVVPIMTGVAAAVKGFFGAIGEALAAGDIDTFLKLIGTVIAGFAVFQTGSLVTSIVGFFQEVKGVASGISEIIEGISGSFEALQNKLNSEALMKIAVAIGVLVAALWVLSGIDSESLLVGLAAISVLFYELSATMAALGKSVGSVKIGALAVGVIAISVALLLLTTAMQKLSHLSHDELVLGATGLFALVSALNYTASALSKSAPTLKQSVGPILAIAAAILIMTIAVEKLGKLDSDTLLKGLVSVAVLLGEIAGFTRIVKPEQLASVGGAMILMSAALVIMSGAVAILGSLDVASLAAGLIGLGVILAEVAGFTQITKESDLMATAAGMIVLGVALTTISGAVAILGSMDVASLAAGLGAIAVILLEIATFTQITREGDLAGTALAMIVLGVALMSISGAVAILGSLDITSLVAGLIGLGVILAEVAGFTQITKEGDLMATAAGMIVLGVALTVISDVIAKLGALSLEELAKGLIAMGVALAEIAGFTQLVKPEKLLATAIAMTIMGAALLIIAGAVKSFGSMSWEDMAKGLIALGGSLLVIALAANAMSGALLGAAALLVMAAAIALLIPSFLILGSMDLAAIGTALLALAGIFLVLGVAGLVLAPITPIILALAGAVALLGIGVMTIGTGLALFATGLAALVTVGAAGIAAFILLIEAIIEIMPKIGVAIAETMVGFIRTIGENAPIIIDSIKQIILGLLDMINEVIPKIFETIQTYVIKMLEMVREVLPAIFETIKVFLYGLIDLVREMTPPLLEVIFELITLLGQTLLEHVPIFVDIGMKLLVGVLQGLAENIDDVVIMALLIIQRLLEGIAAGIPGIAHAGMSLILSLLDAIATQVPRLIDAGFRMIIDFVNGLANAIRDNTDPLIAAAQNLAGAIVEGLAKGVLGGASFVVDSIKNVGNTLISGFKDLLGIHSPSTVFEEAGENIVDGLNAGLDKGTDKALQSGAMLGTAVEKGMSADSNPMGDIGGSYGSDFLGGIMNQMPAAESTGTSLTDSFGSGLSTSSFDISAIGGSFGSDFLGGISSTLPDAESTGTSLADSFGSGLSMGSFDINSISGGLGSDFLGGLGGTAPLAESAGSDITSSLGTGLSGGSEDFNSIGQGLGTDFLSGVNTSSTDAEAAGRNVVDSAAIGMLDNQQAFVEAGEKSADSFIQGLESKKVDVTRSAVQIIGVAAKHMMDLTKDVTVVGKDYGVAFIEGLESTLPKAISLSAEYVAELIKSITTTLKDAMSTGVEFGKAFVEGVVSTQSKASVSGVDLATHSSKGVLAVVKEVAKIGSEFGVEFITGVESTYPDSLTAGVDLATYGSDGLLAVVKEVAKIGSEFGTQFINGLTSTQEKAASSSLSFGLKTVEALEDVADEFESIGVQSALGFIKGLQSSVNAAKEAATNLAKAAANAIKAELDVQSPSRLFKSIGVFTGQGFVDGLNVMIEAASDSAVEMGSKSLDGIKDAISKIANVMDEDMELAPTITPVLDLSDIQNGSSSLSKMFSNLSGNIPVIADIEKRMSKNGRDSENSVNGEKTAGTTYNFEQNNYSPKALTRLEIYRQTKNQFAQLKEEVEGA